MKLTSLSVHGYKSIRQLEDFELRDMNVLIGANGAGKSNFISLFRMLAAILDGYLQEYVRMQAGGPDALLRKGRKKTPQLEVEYCFGSSSKSTGYSIRLLPTIDNKLIFKDESLIFYNEHPPKTIELGKTHEEAFQSRKLKLGENEPISLFPQTWRVYHFHDTSDTAAVKQIHPSNDNLRLKPDAANLAPYLAYLKANSPDAYRNIVDTIRLAAPFFGDFVIRDPLPAHVELEWTEQGDPDTPYRAHVLSDGTLRFICLTTLLLQPAFRLPDTVLIDEPELGLHPYAISLLAEMLKQAAETKQVIVSTQSVELLNHFEPEDVVVVEREGDASVFKRLDAQELADWLEDYSLGELWQRNVFGGRPAR